MKDFQTLEENLWGKLEARDIESGMIILAPFGEDRAMIPLPILFTDKSETGVVSCVLGSEKDVKIFSDNIGKIPITKKSDTIIICPEYNGFLPFKDCIALRDKSFILYEFFDKSA